MNNQRVPAPAEAEESATVSGRYMRAALSVYARASNGAAVEDAAHFADLHHRVPWDAAAQLLAVALRTFGDDTRFEDAFAAEVSGLMPRAIALLAEDAAGVFRVFAEMYVPALLPMARVTLGERPDEGIDITVTLRDGFGSSEAFLRSVVGLHRGLLDLVELPGVVVAASVTEREAHIRVRHGVGDEDSFGPRAATVRPDEILAEVGALHRETLGALRRETPLTPAPDRVLQAAVAWDLTARQRDVLGCLARGMANKEIAVALECALPTVATHVVSIFRKAGVSSRAGLLAKLLR